MGLQLYAQNHVYIDENLKKTDSLDYSEKCLLRAFKCYKYQVDSLIIYKILPKFQFGKIDQTAYTQIRKLLMRDSHENIESNKTLIIKFFDTIYPYKMAYKNHVKHMQVVHHVEIDSVKESDNYNPNLTEEAFIESRKDFVKNSKKCIKKFEGRFNSEIFYMVDENNGIANEYKNFNWVTDNGFFKNNFFKFRSHYSTVFIKPDGEYFLIGSHFSDQSAKKLLRNDDWTKHKKDWQETLTINRFEGSGIFEIEPNYSHQDHCF
ncbi:hypothetical protein [Bizionia psychrotolerans]|uniref:hypothetical protein n=1 Tax=Bizionia psychrotolerans TaxID=1492901 RepID=UPI0012E0887E|nr:hypothetical protein [Bizionia psychrotolerans]